MISFRINSQKCQSSHKMKQCHLLAELNFKLDSSAAHLYWSADEGENWEDFDCMLQFSF